MTWADLLAVVGIAAGLVVLVVGACWPDGDVPGDRPGDVLTSIPADMVLPPRRPRPRHATPTPRPRHAQACAEAAAFAAIADANPDLAVADSRLADLYLIPGEQS